jgi:hypothetical protein
MVGGFLKLEKEGSQIITESTQRAVTSMENAIL